MGDTLSNSHRWLHYRHAIRLLVSAIIFIIDTGLIGAAAFSAALVRFSTVSDTKTDELLLALLLPFAVAAIALKSYSLEVLRSRQRAINTVLMAFGIAVSTAFLAAFAFQVGANYSRIQTATTLLLVVIYLVASRLMFKEILDRMAPLIDLHTMVLVPESLKHADFGSAEVIVPSGLPDPNVPKMLEQFYAQVRHADRILLAFKDATERMQWINFVRLVGIDAELIEPELQQVSPLGIAQWGGMPTLVIARGPLKIHERILKRLMDIGLGLLLLLLLLPVLLLAMVLVRLTSPGPAIFAQVRVGRNNRPYLCYKLRTMRADAADPSGNRSTSREDDRITSIGKFLRRTSIDELPQLWNVLKGEMSLVGPRPHALGTTVEGALFWEVLPGYWMRHAMKPGLTGLAQVQGFRGTTHHRSDIEQRVAADLDYINNWSIGLDLAILLRTVLFLFHRNAY